MTKQQFQVPPHIVRWLLNEVVDGLKDLLILKLSDHPAAETITIVAIKWCEILQAQNITWDKDLDTPRIKAAFMTLKQYQTEWPAPRHLLDALPRRPQPKELPPGPITQEEALEIQKILKGHALDLRAKTIDSKIRREKRLKELEEQRVAEIERRKKAALSLYEMTKGNQ